VVNEVGHDLPPGMSKMSSHELHLLLLIINDYFCQTYDLEICQNNIKMIRVSVHHFIIVLKHLIKLLLKCKSYKDVTG
jgi:hypothetical protein